MTDSALYLHHVSSGDYDRLAANISSLNKHALIGLEYGRDFERNQKNGFITKSSSKPIPFSTWIFGEIARHNVGTLHQASGNHFIGRPPVLLCPPVPFFRV